MMSSSDINKVDNITNRVASARPRQNYQNFKPKKTFVQQLPFWERYRRGCVFGGAFLTFCIVYSAPIYYFFRTPPDHVDPRSTMWPSEIATGKTKVEMFREKLQRQEEQKAAAQQKYDEYMAKKNNTN